MLKPMETHAPIKACAAGSEAAVIPSDTYGNSNEQTRPGHRI